ncbi:mannose-P-dolichol utilization defect 1 protein-like [Stegastes partitus]|uniref:Mannose-P-dolichol utilization defect 1 protein-like n=1 Tax=Stegastes partitus TaxID=144197 RepID=A0A3B4ZG13_9TELE|nr:PREDICTED: mannose-P-dolichol utilization defect 1 protein-like [Stegastes partitus]
MATSPLRDFLVTYLMPEKCYEHIFVHLHWHVPCLKFVLNKTVGFWIILDTFLAQLPQLLKILWRGNAEGLSLISVLLQLYAFSCPVVYAIANHFPLFAWAERLITLAQTAAIVFLILHYRGNTLAGVLLPSGFGGLVFLLGSYATAAVASVIHSSSLAALIASKVFQTTTNHQNGHTGQLSTLSVLLSWAGSLGVVWISLQETGGSLATLSHILSAGLSCVLLVQVLCYRSITGTDAKKRE